MNCLGPRSPLVLMLCGWSLRVPKHPITEVSRLRRDLQLGRPDKTGRSNAASASEGPYFKPSSPQRADLVDLTPRLGWSRSTVRYSPARAVRLSERSSTYGMPMSTANTTMPASAIADTSLPTVRVVSASAPSCPRSIQAAPVTITLKCRLRSDRCSPPSSIRAHQPA